MKTKQIATTYAHGYTLAPSYRDLDIDASGTIENGLTLNAGHAVSVTNDGVVTGVNDGPYAAGGVGLTVTGAANLSGPGRITGGGGGAGVLLNAATSLTMAAGTIGGGAGGAGVGDGGSGGVGVGLSGTSILVRKAGTITGGAGADGYHPGGGGTGVALGAGASLTSAGIISGGQGGRSRIDSSGAGGAGVALQPGANATLMAGTITGGQGGLGGYYPGGPGGSGVIVTGAARVTVARATIAGGEGGYDASYHAGLGGAGVVIAFGASLTTTGTIVGGAGGASHTGATGKAGDGVDIDAGGTVVNGDATHGNALISGFVGVSLYGSGVGTVTNFATIEGIGGTSVAFTEAGDRLIVETGAVFLGAVKGGGGTLELAGASGAIENLGATGTLSGGQKMTFSGFGSYDFDAGGGWKLTGANTSAASLINAGTLTLARNATLTIQRTVDNSGVISLGAKTAAGTLIVGAAGVTVSGAGSVVLDAGGRDAIIGASATSTLTNVDNTITGSGRIGEAEMKLVNGPAGLIAQTGSLALTLDTGTYAIANAGTIAATGKGGLTIAGAVATSGLLEAVGGDLTLQGVVTGSGRAMINAGTLNAGAAFTQDVTFRGTSGELELADGTAYAGDISGFSNRGRTSLDLRDIGFVGAGEATFSGTAAGGVLTVTDGTKTAMITLVGDYTRSTFTASSDGAGGTIVVDAAAPPRAGAFVAHMSSLAPSGAGAGAGPAAAPLSPHPPTLAMPRPNLA